MLIAFMFSFVTWAYTSNLLSQYFLYTWKLIQQVTFIQWQIRYHSFHENIVNLHTFPSQLSLQIYLIHRLKWNKKR
jgi:hypothetical protein